MTLDEFHRYIANAPPLTPAQLQEQAIDRAVGPARPVYLIWTKVRGSHKDEQRITRILDRNPGIHSGFAGKRAFCCYLTQEEFDKLKTLGFKVSLRNKK